MADLLDGASDPYALARGEQLIKEASLLRLRACLAQVESQSGSSPTWRKG